MSTKRTFTATVIVGLMIASMVSAEAAPTRQQLRRWREQTQDALRNAATAEESYYVDNNHYSQRLGDLQREGYRASVHIHLFVSWTSDSWYCLQATRDGLDETWHYDAFRSGRPERGRCPATERALHNWREDVSSTLKNAATAQESYWTTNESYTRSLHALTMEGLFIPHEVYLKVQKANKSRYCMQATHLRLPGLWSYDSDEGRPLKGRCT